MDNKKRSFVNKPKAQTFGKARNPATNRSETTNSSQQPKKIRTNVENDEDFDESQEMDEDMDFLSQEMIDEDMDINDEFCMFCPYFCPKRKSVIISVYF